MLVLLRQTVSLGDQMHADVWAIDSGLISIDVCSYGINRSYSSSSVHLAVATARALGEALLAAAALFPAIEAPIDAAATPDAPESTETEMPF